MIISHEHRFIFIKTQKTAGTSIEVFLSRLCGADDVVTPFGVPEPGHAPRNFAGFFNHMSAKEVIASIGRATWDAYFTFCFERNPWDKVVSHYWFAKGKGQIPEDCAFAHYLRHAQLPHNLWQYTDGSAPLVDVVGRYERLEADLARILEQAGIAAEITLPRAKGQFRPAQKHYSEHYGLAERDFVAERFADEIALHGYRFEAAKASVT